MNCSIQGHTGANSPRRQAGPYPAEVVSAATALGLDVELVTLARSSDRIPYGSHGSQLCVSLIFSLPAFPAPEA